MADVAERIVGDVSIDGHRLELGGVDAMTPGSRPEMSPVHRAGRRDRRLRGRAAARHHRARTRCSPAPTTLLTHRGTERARGTRVHVVSVDGGLVADRERSARSCSRSVAVGAARTDRHAARSPAVRASNAAWRRPTPRRLYVADAAPRTPTARDRVLGDVPRRRGRSARRARASPTHWARANGTAGRGHAAIDVDPDPIYVRDGDVWTSAGVTAGIDLALALVEDDHGTDVAQLVARWLVMFLRRPGGQTQFAAPVWMPARRPLGPIRAAQERRSTPTPAAITASSALAGRVGDERAPLHHGASAAQVGETPGPVRRARPHRGGPRVRSSRRTDTVDAIARRCGFGSAETMRRTFVRRLGVSPDALPPTLPASERRVRVRPQRDT